MSVNPNYTIAAGSASTVIGPYTAFSAPMAVIKRDWENIWLRKQPLLAMLRDGELNWNKGSGLNGNLMLLPINTAAPTTPPAGVNNSAELTPITPWITQGATQAQYYIAHYRGAFYKRASESRENNNMYGNIDDFKVKQFMDSFTKVVNADLSSTNADAENAILGIRQVLSTSNTVGQISQSSLSDWQSNVNTTPGAFTLDLVDNQMDTVITRNGKIKLMLFSFLSGNNVFGKLRASIAPAQRLVNVEFSAKYGFENIVYRDATCVQDNVMATGTNGLIVGLDADTWFYRGDEYPQLVHDFPLTGTDAKETMYNYFASLGCNNPARNFYVTNISA